MTENRGVIEIGSETGIQEYSFKKRVWNYTVYDDKENLIIYSKLFTNSMINRFLGIAPIVFYDSGDNEIVRINDHFSIKKHSVIFNGTREIDGERGKYQFVYGNNKVVLNPEKNQIEFECEDKYVLHFIVISITMWNKYNQAP